MRRLPFYKAVVGSSIDLTASEHFRERAKPCCVKLKGHPPSPPIQQGLSTKELIWHTLLEASHVHRFIEVYPMLLAQMKNNLIRRVGRTNTLPFLQLKATVLSVLWLIPGGYRVSCAFPERVSGHATFWRGSWLGAFWFLNASYFLQTLKKGVDTCWVIPLCDIACKLWHSSIRDWVWILSLLF